MPNEFDIRDSYKKQTAFVNSLPPSQDRETLEFLDKLQKNNQAYKITQLPKGFDSMQVVYHQLIAAADNNSRGVTAVGKRVRKLTPEKDENISQIVIPNPDKTATVLTITESAGGLPTSIERTNMSIDEATAQLPKHGGGVVVKVSRDKHDVYDVFNAEKQLIAPAKCDLVNEDKHSSNEEVHRLEEKIIQGKSELDALRTELAQATLSAKEQEEKSKSELAQLQAQLKDALNKSSQASSAAAAVQSDKTSLAKSHWSLWTIVSKCFSKPHKEESSNTPAPTPN